VLAGLSDVARRGARPPGYIELYKTGPGRLRMPAKKKQKQAAAAGKNVKPKKKKTSRGK
jgi:hypothetical protein